MDETVNRYAQELAEAIAAALANDARVETCRARARAAGYEMRVTLEAIVGFTSCSGQGEPDERVTMRAEVPAAPAAPRRSFEMTASDRRFLRSLRIAADDTD